MIRSSVLLVASAALVLGCGDSGEGTGGTGGSGGADDGKLHPPGDGTELDEDAACAELHDALGELSLGLSCVSTLRACPNLLEALSGEACAIYDGGSVGGCVEYYGEATDCDDLKARADLCVPDTLSGCAE
ncbi:MAG: hypothetical protein IPM79_21725 [Polyangiaceae bacterium]|jgi:hypothetical protein|nr:hypothetical protein [Polyangiaceae bacterium]MBK8940164.1 hypothetical protein [Polyangiaceae bacterium]